MTAHITPGLFGISEETPIRTIRTRWHDLIFPLLSKEEGIYNAALEAISYRRIYPLNQDTTFKIFLILLEVHPDLLSDNEDSELLEDEKTILYSMFSIYWDLSKNQDFWIKDHFLVTSGYLKFSDALLIWKNKFDDDVKTCEERLEQWAIEN